MAISPVISKALGAIALSTTMGTSALSAALTSQTTSTLHIVSLAGACVSGISTISLTGLLSSHISPRILPSIAQSTLFATACISGTASAALSIMAVVFLGQLPAASSVLSATPLSIMIVVAVITLIAFLAHLGFLVAHLAARRPAGPNSSDPEAKQSSLRLASSMANIKSIRYSTTLPAAFSSVSSSDGSTLAYTGSAAPSLEKVILEKAFSPVSSPKNKSPTSTIRSDRNRAMSTTVPALDLERVNSAALSISTVTSGTTIQSPIASPAGLGAPLAPRPSSRVPKRVSVESLRSTRSGRSASVTGSGYHHGSLMLSPVSIANSSTSTIASTVHIPSCDLGFDTWELTLPLSPGSVESLASIDATSAASSPNTTAAPISLPPPQLKNKSIPSRLLLETIPQSPTIPLRTDVSCNSSHDPDSLGTLDLPPVIDPDNAPRGRRRSRTQGSTTLSRPPSSTPEHVRTVSAKSAQSHIHPLFRSDSPGPPPLATPGTVVLAAPEAGRVLASRVSIRNLKRIHSGSLPAVRSSLSRQSSVDDFAPTRPRISTLESHGAQSIRSMSTTDGDYDGEDYSAVWRSSEESGGSIERAMTPPIPDWVLSPHGRRREEPRMNPQKLF